jgi:hypothetical protein
MDFTITIKYGTVEPQIRSVPIPNGLKSQSRRVERDLSGAITLISEWEDLGSSITLGAPGKSRPWWAKWLPKSLHEAA